MPRRPRPAKRASAVVEKKKETKDPLSAVAVESDFDESSVAYEDVAFEDVATGSEEDIDAPRVAQWVDDEDLSEESVSSEDEEEEQEEHAPRPMKELRNDLSSLPFGALRKAQKALAKVAPDSGTETDEHPDVSGLGSEDEPSGSGLGRSYTSEWDAEAKSKKELAKRKSKHAPTELTSKRPVSRRRTVVEVQKMEVRDPRFLPLAGELDPKKFRTQYGFIGDLYQDELRTLRENLKRARKMLSSSPRGLREERELEVKRLELAVKRAESLVNRDKRAKVEQEALSRMVQQEKGKRQQGKGAFWLKKSERKKELLKARYEAVAAEGGGRAVKKAIEKKQRKLSQKETKSRPFPRATPGSGSNVQSLEKRRASDRSDGARAKRIRT